LQEAQSADPFIDVSEDSLSDEALSILVVDDNKVNLMVAQLQLQKCWPQARITTADTKNTGSTRKTTACFDMTLVLLSTHGTRKFPE
jgi:CheY-like chemotaxis protein